jgi:hypothetical protein
VGEGRKGHDSLPSLGSFVVDDSLVLYGNDASLVRREGGAEIGLAVTLGGGVVEPF